jgi:hypothetical protein
MPPSTEPASTESPVKRWRMEMEFEDGTKREVSFTNGKLYTDIDTVSTKGEVVPELGEKS